MLVIRSTRVGKKGERKFRVSLAEKRSRRDGKTLENLGWYTKSGQRELNKERINFWISKGARVSPAISKLLET